jgi:hypothetical protein
MAQVTYVSIVPRESSAKLRETLRQNDTGELKWREQRSGSGSEFYFTGPPTLARQTHEFVTLWLANQKLAAMSRRH